MSPRLMRGSGKSHFFGGLLIDDYTMEPGLRTVCVREVQRSIKESSKRLLEDKVEKSDASGCLWTRADRKRPKNPSFI